MTPATPKTAGSMPSSVEISGTSRNPPRPAAAGFEGGMNGV